MCRILFKLSQAPSQGCCLLELFLRVLAYITLSTQAHSLHHIKGIGVGDSHASPTAALLLSVLQETMGRISTILFAHRLGTALEPECKMYRLAADIFNDAAMILDCLSPAFPKAARVGVLSASSVLRSLCGVAAGSSKASLSAHFATQGNLGELNAVGNFFLCDYLALMRCRKTPARRPLSL